MSLLETVNFFQAFANLFFLVLIADLKLVVQLGEIIVFIIFLKNGLLILNTLIFVFLLEFVQLFQIDLCLGDLAAIVFYLELEQFDTFILLLEILFKIEVVVPETDNLFLKLVLVCFILLDEFLEFVVLLSEIVIVLLLDINIITQFLKFLLETLDLVFSSVQITLESVVDIDSVVEFISQFLDIDVSVVRDFFEGHIFSSDFLDFDILVSQTGLGGIDISSKVGNIFHVLFILLSVFIFNSRLFFIENVVSVFKILEVRIEFIEISLILSEFKDFSFELGDQDILLVRIELSWGVDLSFIFHK